MSTSRSFAWAFQQLSTFTCLVMSLCCLGCDTGEPDDSTVLISPEDDMSPPMPSMDARCMNQTCSGKGVCQILAESPICVCQEGYQAEDLTCKEVPVGAPQITALSKETVRLTEGEAVTLTLEVRHEGQAQAVLRYVDPDDPTFTEDVYPFESEGSGVFTLEISWQGIDDLIGIDFENESIEDLFEVYVEDGEGRSAKRPLLLQLHCDGKGGSACDGSCVDLATSVEHCGACYSNTPQGASCTQGERVCDNPSLVACDDACVTNDDMNCGRCGNVCEGGASCQAEEGVCAFLEVTAGPSDSASFRSLHPCSRSIPSLHVEDYSGRVHQLDQYCDEYDFWYGSQNSEFGYRVRSSSDSDWTWLMPPTYPAGQFVYDQQLVQDPATQKLTVFYLAAPSDDSPAMAHLYMSTKDTFDIDWEAPVQISTSPIPTQVQYKGFQVSVDPYGMHHLSYRTMQGFEVFSRANADQNWRFVGQVVQEYVNPGFSNRFGHVYDVKRGIHHVVFRDELNLYHVQMGQDGVVRSKETFEQGLFRQYEGLSQIYIDTQDVLHLMYGKDDILFSRTYSLIQKSWTQPEALTQPSDKKNYPLPYQPDPRSFVMDKEGNKWVLMQYGWLTVLFYKRSHEAFWSDRLVSSARIAGETSYISAKHMVAVSTDFDGNPTVHTYHRDKGVKGGELWVYGRYSY